MKLLFIFPFIFLLYSCKMNENPVEKKYNNRKSIFGFDFKNEEIKSIEIVEIEHPMLGGIVKTLKLSETQKAKFLNELDQLKEKGIYKCYSKHIIRLIKEKDTLRLKVCGNMISNRHSDLYFESADKNFLDKYLNYITTKDHSKT